MCTTAYSSDALNYATLPLPNEDFGRSNQRFRMRFRSTFQGCEYSILGYESLKSASKTHSERLVRPSKIFVWEGYTCKSTHPLNRASQLRLHRIVRLRIVEKCFPGKRTRESGGSFVLSQSSLSPTFGMAETHALERFVVRPSHIFVWHALGMGKLTRRHAIVIL
jgi:hypothetical protein